MDSDYQPSLDCDDAWSSCSSFSEYGAAELMKQFGDIQKEVFAMQKLYPYKDIMQPRTTKKWKEAKAKRTLGYSSNSSWTKHHYEKARRDGAEERKRV